MGFEQLLTLVGTGTVLLLVLHFGLALVTRKNVDHSRRGILPRLIYVAFFLLVLGLGVTSFGSILWNGVMEHQSLLIHVSLGGAFVVVMTLFAMAWNPVYRHPDEADGSEQGPWWLWKSSLWCVVLLVLVVSGSMLVQMVPWLDTEGMLQATVIHRYAGLGLTVALLANAYALILQRLGWR
jgi:hypothetical protein